MIGEINREILNKVYKPRDPQAHKYDFGSLLIVGGSKLYHGSPAFNALAAYRTGVDLVTIVAPQRAADIIASFSPDLITYPLEGGHLNPSNVEEVLEFLKGKTALVIGGGLGREGETLEAIVEILDKTHLPTVIDADAIYAVADNKEVLKGEKFVLTPHAYEFQILTGDTPPQDLDERVEMVKRHAVGLASTIVLKGNPDIISDGQQIAVNRTGNPFMTVGGTGDTLAGILGALLAQGVGELDAACAATYINGAAGDIAAAQLGPSFLASDLLDFIPQVILEGI